MKAIYMGLRRSLIALSLLAVVGCDRKDDSATATTDLAFAGPADPNGFRAPPTISIENQGGRVARRPDYDAMVRCSAAVTVLRDQLRGAGQLGARQLQAVDQAAALVRRRLQASAAAAKKSSNDVSTDVAAATDSAAERPDESVREALGCIQQLAT